MKAISVAGLKITPDIMVSGAANGTGADGSGGGLVQVLLAKMLNQKDGDAPLSKAGSAKG